MTTFNITPDMSIEQLGEIVSDYLQNRWKKVLDENIEELERIFPEYEDATYGMYVDKLLPPMWTEIEKHGFRSAAETREDDFVIAGCLHFRNSMEKAKWGTPDHEVRIFWIVIENRHNEQIGTFLFELPHSHTQFRLPAPPALTVLEETERKEITSKILQLKENE
ncbi:MAG TPA: DUF6022 family protein [Bacillus sp. (in: firmicutes)]|nr:DUF6022 family protein [Bacillus sp. (in: firmicutes)]